VPRGDLFVTSKPHGLTQSFAPPNFIRACGKTTIPCVPGRFALHSDQLAGQCCRTTAHGKVKPDKLFVSMPSIVCGDQAGESIGGRQLHSHRKVSASGDPPSGSVHQVEHLLKSSEHSGTQRDWRYG
jgi:hypothetical protein